MRKILIIFFIVMLFSSLSYAVTPIQCKAADLVNYWTLDEADGDPRLDSCNNANFSTVSTPGQQTGAACKFGNCADFDRANGEYLSAVYPQALLQWGENFTIFYYVNFDVNNVRQFLMGSEGAGNDGGILHETPSVGTLGFWRAQFDDFENIQVGYDSVPPTGEWLCQMVNVNNTHIRQFVNETNTQLTFVEPKAGPLDVPATNFWYVGTFWAFDPNFMLDGKMDEVAIFNYSLSLANFTEICDKGIAAFVGTREIVIHEPAKNPQSNNTQDTFNIECTDPTDIAFLYFNFSGGFSRITNTTTTVIWLTNVTEERGYEYFASCSDTLNSSGIRIWNYDLTSPVIRSDFQNGSIFFTRNLTANFNFTDNITINRINITIDGETILNQSNVNATYLTVNISTSILALNEGAHILQAFVSDGHTKYELKNRDDYNPNKGIFGDVLEYNFRGVYKKERIKMYFKDWSLGDRWDYEADKDRYREIVIPANPNVEKTIVVESDKYIDIMEDPNGKYGGKWLAIGEHWKDFVLKGEEKAYIKSIIYINRNKVEVTIAGIKNINRLEFESTGDLNTDTLNFTFFVKKFTEEFDSLAIIGFPQIYKLSLFNMSPIQPNVTFEFNNTNFSASIFSENVNEIVYNITLLSNFSESVIQDHRWKIQIGQNNDTTDFINQSFLKVLVGNCTGPDRLNFSIFNMTYIDGSTSELIEATNSYDFKITDGLFMYNQNGTFNLSTNNSICTNINGSQTVYNWSLWGTILLSKDLYATNLFTFDSSNPINISNNPVTEIDLTMLKLNESTTFQYEWITTAFQPVNGIMEIYKCNGDGTRTLVNSVNIIDSTAYANIDLLNTPYSYEVIIDGIRFIDISDGFTTCHIESTTPRRYFVQITEPVTAAVGLYSVDCNVTKTGVDTVKVSWGENPESDTDITGCLIANRFGIGGFTEIFRECIVGVSIERTIPNTGFTYTVSGTLTQNSRSVECNDVISFNTATNTATLFDLSGLFAVALLVITLALLFASKGEEQVIASIGGLVLAWVIGLLAMPWMTISALLVFGVIIVLIGRYSRKQ